MPCQSFWHARPSTLMMLRTACNLVKRTTVPRICAGIQGVPSIRQASFQMRRLGDDLARLTVLPISGTTFVDDSLPVTVMTLLPSLALVLVYDPMALLKMVASLEKAPLPASAGCCDDVARLASGCPGRTVAAAAVVDMLAESSQRAGCSADAV